VDRGYVHNRGKDIRRRSTPVKEQNSLLPVLQYHLERFVQCRLKIERFLLDFTSISTSARVWLGGLAVSGMVGG
jgi:hypothetical protein